MTSQRFVIDVGGIFFCSTRSTLSKSPTLKKLVDASENSELFIDRESSSFVFILNYLRTGLILQDLHDKSYIKCLINEAQFYGIPDMVPLLRDMTYL